MMPSDTGKSTVILFDASGTIINDLKVTHQIVNQILHHHGKPQMTLGEFRGIFSLPYWRIFEGFGLSEQIAKVDCLKLYKKLVQIHSQKIKTFADVEPTLKSLSKTKALGIVSQVPKSTLKSFLAKSKLEQYFSKVISLENSAEQKPSPLPLLIACESLGCRPNEAIYVGDQYEDVLAARNARIFSIAISRRHSYHTYPKLVSARPDLIISNLGELVNLEIISC